MVAKTILYAEDNPDDVFIFKMAFKRAHLPYTLVTIDDGQLAVEWLTAKIDTPAELVITDIKMPRKNGFELLEWIRTHPVYQPVPVLILSSSDEPRDVKRAEELGASKYFVKTPQFQDVMHFLQTLERA